MRHSGGVPGMEVALVPRGSAHPGRGHSRDAGTRGLGGGGAGGAGAPGVQRDAQGQRLQGSGTGGCSSLGMLVSGVGARRDAATKGMGTGSRYTGCQGCSSWDVQDSGSRNAGTQGFREQGVLAPEIPASCAAALGLQGLLVSKNKCIWHAGDRSSQRGNAQDADSQGMPQRGREAVLRRQGWGETLPRLERPFTTLKCYWRNCCEPSSCLFPSHPISCSPKPMLSVPGAPGAPVLRPSLLHCPGAG